jgi:hypothetical protein
LKYSLKEIIMVIGQSNGFKMMKFLKLKKITQLDVSLNKLAVL